MPKASNNKKQKSN